MPHWEPDLLVFAKPGELYILGSLKEVASAAMRAHGTNRTFSTGLACLKFRFVSSPLVVSATQMVIY